VVALAVFLIAGLIGAVLLLVLFDWTLIVLSSLAGASLIVMSAERLLQMPPIAGTVIVLVLAAIGALIQAASGGAGGPRPEEGEMNRERIVIIGASLTGATAAATLREEGFDGAIDLIGAEAQPPYNRPPLSKEYLRGQARFEAQLVKPVDYYAEQRITLRLGVRASAVDSKRKLVELEGGEQIAYDRLLVATGGATGPSPGRGGPGGPLSASHGRGLRPDPRRRPRGRSRRRGRARVHRVRGGGLAATARARGGGRRGPSRAAGSRPRRGSRQGARGHPS
jgi:hypothetical protein